MNISTNVGKYFLNAVERHFGSDKTLKKLFNRNNIKVSYSCGPNVKQQVKGHNARVLKSHRKEELGCRVSQGDEGRECNCRRGNTCPLGGKCLIKNIIYQATVSTDGDEDKDHYYTGQTTTTFKERLYNHTHSFKKASKRKSCALAQHIWDLKLSQKEYSISWKILKHYL